MRSRRGYTVLEMLTVVAIIGVLAATALNNYKAQTMRAKRVEAIEGLSTVWKAQMSYFAEHSRFAASFDAIDFQVEGGHKISLTSYQGQRYFYQLSQPWGTGSFYCIATANLDEDAWPDILEIYNQGTN